MPKRVTPQQRPLAERLVDLLRQTPEGFRYSRSGLLEERLAKELGLRDRYAAMELTAAMDADGMIVRLLAFKSIYGLALPRAAQALDAKFMSEDQVRPRVEVRSRSGYPSSLMIDRRLPSTSREPAFSRPRSLTA